MAETSTLAPAVRKVLERKISAARDAAEEGAKKALEHLAVHEKEARPGMSDGDRKLRRASGEGSFARDEPRKPGWPTTADRRMRVQPVAQDALRRVPREEFNQEFPDAPGIRRRFGLTRGLRRARP